MILGAKFMVVMIYEYLTELVFLLPIMAAFGIKSGAGILYYAYAIIIFLTVPIVPLVVSSLISMIIMRFIPFTKNKDAFKTVAGVFGLALAIGFNIVFQRMGANSQNQDQLMLLMLQGNNSLLNTTSKFIPTVKAAANAMLYSSDIKGIINLLLFLFISLAALGILLLLGEVLYFKGVIGISEASSKRKKLSKKELDESTTQNSMLKSYIAKELKLLFRTPAYFMNCVLMNFLFPIIFLIPVFSQPEIAKSLGTVRYIIKGGNVPGYILSMAFGFMMFIAVSNPTASTAISREGQNIFVCKYLPVSYKKQIMAKVLSSIILNCIGLGLMIILAMVILLPPVYMLVQLLIMAALITLFASFMGIFIDLNFPKLGWDNEQRAVKQNMNVIISMFGGIVVTGLVILVVSMFGLGIWSAFGVYIAVFAVLDVVLFWLISTVGVKMFGKIQV
jgi:ABC-2 type transport system permease protein